jgi:hypothetical protein
MPLDKARGEVLEGYEGKAFIVLPVSLIADMNQILVPYLKPGKLGQKAQGVRPLFEDAMAKAADAFAAKGLLVPVARDESAILIQLYPHQKQLVFVVARMLNGEEHFTSPISYELPQPVFNQIVAAAKRALLH